MSKKNHFLRKYNSKIEFDPHFSEFKYQLRTKKYTWDSTSFNPKPDKILKRGSYKGEVYIERKHLLDGRQIIIPRKIVIRKKTFINIR